MRATQLSVIKLPVAPPVVSFTKREKIAEHFVQFFGKRKDNVSLSASKRLTKMELAGKIFLLSRDVTGISTFIPTDLGDVRL